MKQEHTTDKIIQEMAKKYNLPEEQFSMRWDGRCEWICQHGIGHTVYGFNSHGCDGCCSNLKEATNK